MKLEVGEFYLTDSKEIVFIERKDNDGFFVDTDENRYKENGTLSMFQSSEFDLIAHIPKELHFDIIKTIKAYHSDNSIKEYIDYAYNNKGK